LLTNIHARELSTPEIAMRLLNHLLADYGKNANVAALFTSGKMRTWMHLTLRSPPYSPWYKL